MDSDILIDVLRKESETITKIKELENQSTILATTVINSYELLYGAYKTKKKNHLKLVNELLNNLIILEWKKGFSDLAAKIMADLEKRGKMVGMRDLFIGVITIKHDYKLFTRNIKDFERIGNIELI
ncbi:MAG: type II toxin-antitoxin system VapC family toxin [Promethearchaeota archaeon]